VVGGAPLVGGAEEDISIEVAEAEDLPIEVVQAEGSSTTELAAKDDDSVMEVENEAKL